jgi:hypothetical protein
MPNSMLIDKMRSTIKLIWNKEIKTTFGENEIKVPSDKNSSFNPILVSKRGNVAQGR